MSTEANPMLNFAFGGSSARTENGIKTIESNSVLHIRGLVGIVMTYVKKIWKLKAGSVLPNENTRLLRKQGT